MKKTKLSVKSSAKIQNPFLVHLGEAACLFIALLYAGIWVASALVEKIGLSVRMFPALAITVACISMLFSSFFLAKMQKKKGLVIGAGFAVSCQIVFMFILSFLGEGSQPIQITPMTGYRLLAMAVSGAVGGYLAMLTVDHKKYTHA